MGGQEQALLLALGAVAGAYMVLLGQMLADVVVDRMIRRRRAALEGDRS